MDVEQALAFTDALVFTKAGIHLSDLQQAMLRESWSWQRQSYDQIAETYGYSPTYLKHDVGPKLWRLLSEVIGEKVNKTSFRAAIERKSHTDGISTQTQAAKPDQLHISQPTAEAVPASRVSDAAVEPSAVLTQVASAPRQDWGDAADVSFFYGRAAELTRLEQWILGSQSQQPCRLVAVLGMGGMGKTSLVIRLSQRLQSEFEWVIWRSLRNALPPTELLSDLLQLLTNQQQVEQPIERQIAQLLHQLRSRRCLIILDNIETVLHYAQEPELSAVSSQGYGVYRELFRQIGETRHQSCLVLTSREKPPEVALLEGETLPVRSLTLTGLQLSEAQELMSLKGCFQGTDTDWNRLIAGYSGNPLALKIISTTIQTLFDGNLTEFLQQDTFVFGGIRTLIDQQFERLSVLEKSVMYWLAIYREPATFAELRMDIFPSIAPQRLIEVLELLEQRSLIEKQSALFSLQPVVMEYVSDRLITQICTEIQQGVQGIAVKDALLKHHALLKAQSKDYIRETQIRLILTPILERLDALHDALEDDLIQQLTCLRGKSTSESGYAGGNLLNLLGQRKTHLSSYDFSHLTLWQADLRQMQLHQINFAYADLSRSMFAEILGIVFAVALSPTGDVLATGDAEGGLRLWQVNQGSLLLALEGHQGWVWSVSFSADGQTLASCSSDKTIRLWNTQTGECLSTLRGHSGSIWSVSFSPDGQLLASGGDEPSVMLWDASKGTCIKQLAGHTGRILSVAFCHAAIEKSSALLLASGSEDSSIRLWNVQSGKCHQVYQGHADRVWSVAFSPNGELLASGSADRTLKLWQVKTGKCLKTFSEHGDRVRSVSFSADGQTLISSSDDLTVRIWSVDTGQCLHTLWGHTNSIFSVACHSESQMVVSGSADQTVRIWHSQTGQCLKTLRGYTNSIFSVAYSANGEKLISSSTDQTIKLWDTNTGQCLKTFEGHTGWVTSAAFHPQAHLIASSSADETIKLWEASSGQCLRTLQGHSHWVQSVSFSPDGEVLASGGDDCTLRLWSVQSGECLHTLAAHSGWVWSVAFSPMGELLASSSEDQTICLWSTTGLQCVHRLQDHSGRVKAIAFSPDGQLLASGSSDETVRLWSVHTGECLYTLRGHDNDVWSVAFSPDGQTLASRSLDQTVKLWEVSTGVCRKTLSVPSRSVRSAIAFCPVSSPTPKNLATQNKLTIGSHSGTIQIWNIPTGECLNTLTPNRPYDGTNIKGVTGITAAQKLALYALGAIEQ
ncbi:NACHT domain-containing protein [Cyanobacteria bacterium FACHB-471]|nr:NACHT domain-containing protein [Cyanobacteria bacterium FACHB-471]